MTRRAMHGRPQLCHSRSGRRCHERQMIMENLSCPSCAAKLERSRSEAGDQDGQGVVRYGSSVWSTMVSARGRHQGEMKQFGVGVAE